MNRDAVILVAEDEDGHFALIQRNLYRAGLENTIIRFNDGQQALDFFQNDASKQYSKYILLLDLRMPKVSGFEVLAFMKSDPHLKTIPIIILTTANTPQDIQRCHELGCALYIVKPVEYETLVEAIQRIGAFLKVIEIPQTV
jgi:CheY-like chemotaxis protein